MLNIISLVYMNQFRFQTYMLDILDSFKLVTVVQHTNRFFWIAIHVLASILKVYYQNDQIENICFKNSLKLHGTRTGKPVMATSSLRGQSCYLGACSELPPCCRSGGRAQWPQWPGSSEMLCPHSQTNPSVSSSRLLKRRAPPPPCDPTCTQTHTHNKQA